MDSETLASVVLLRNGERCALGLVMFDYDGVIVDSLSVFSINFTSACHDHGVLQDATAQDFINLFEDNVYESMLKIGVSSAKIDEILEDYKMRQEPYLLSMSLFKNIPEALEQIARQHHIYIITSNLSSATRAVLLQNNIHCVEGVIGADLEKSKVKKIERVRALYPNEPAFYIGDTKGDMLEGRRAGAHTVAVTWGWHDEERLLQGKPDYIAQSPQELGEILRQRIYGEGENYG